MEGLEKFQLHPPTKLVVEQADPVNRQCVVTVSHSHQVVRLQASFPTGYPLTATPVFKFLSPTADCQPGMLRSLAKKIEKCALRQMQCGGRCSVMACLELVEEEMVTWQPQMAWPMDSGMELDSGMVPGQHRGVYGYNQQLGLLKIDQLNDRWVPFPRTSGARFSMTGVLVVFRRPTQVAAFTEPTPKSLRELTQQSDYHVGVGQDGSPPSYGYPGYMHPRHQPYMGWTSHHHHHHHHHLLHHHHVNQSVPPPPPETMSISDYYRQKELQSRTKREHQQKRRTQRERTKQFPSASSDLSLASNGTTNGVSKAEGTRSPTSSQVAPVPRDITQPLVVFYDAATLMPLDVRLAESYSVDTDNLMVMCSKNAAAAGAAGRADLVQMWRLLGVMSSERLLPGRAPGKLPPWATLPFGRPLVRTWFESALKIHDVQTLGMLALTLSVLDALWCAALAPRGMLSPPPGDAWGESASSWEMQQQLAASKMQGFYVGQEEDYGLNSKTKISASISPAERIQQLHSTRPRSNSCNGVYDEPESLADNLSPDTTLSGFPGDTPAAVQRHIEKCRLLDAQLRASCDSYLLVYAEILYSWGLLTQRARIMKALSPQTAAAAGQLLGCITNPSSQDLAAAEEELLPWKRNTNNKVLRCALCALPVRGLASVCAHCQHGGHPEHLRDWFSAGHDHCPAACGCLCVPTEC